MKTLNERIKNLVIFAQNNDYESTLGGLESLAEIHGLRPVFEFCCAYLLAQPSDCAIVNFARLCNRLGEVERD